MQLCTIQYCPQVLFGAILSNRNPLICCYFWVFLYLGVKIHLTGESSASSRLTKSKRWPSFTHMSRRPSVPFMWNVAMSDCSPLEESPSGKKSVHPFLISGHSCCIRPRTRRVKMSSDVEEWMLQSHQCFSILDIFDLLSKMHFLSHLFDFKIWRRNR